jgi:hypothetical protein
MKVIKRWIVLIAAPLALAIGLGAAGTPTQVVRWESFVGNIRAVAAGAVGSGTGAVQPAGAPWVATGGTARVDLATGQLLFQIKGLVLADTSGVGTPGNNPEVVGTLVCDADGSASGGNSVLVSTPKVTLTAQGEAQFSGSLGTLPAVCSSEPDTAFLVRSVAGPWFAAGIVRTP